MERNKSKTALNAEEKKKLLNSIFFPVLFTIFLWSIKFVEIQTGWNFTDYGIYPLKVEGFKGIFFAPLIHGSIKHLANNSFPILVLGTAIFYFYREVAYKIVVLSWLLSGFWVWFMARNAYHIGASGLIYAWAAFLFFSGIIRKHINLTAISLLITFLYGSLIWGIFPIKDEISWESHLMGGIAGIILAFYYKQTGPKKTLPDWMEEEDEDDEDEDAYWKLPEQ